jgi:Tol biopolymer transport system component
MVVNGASDDQQPAISSDGTVLVFASNRGGDDAFGGQDLWMSTRTKLTDKH